MKKTCVQCNKEFEITDSELSFYKEKDLSVPKRCKQCRDANRRIREEMNPSRAPQNYNRGNPTKTVAKNNNVPPKKNNRSYILFLALLVALILGISVLFSSGKSQNVEPQATYNNQQQYQYSFTSEDLWVSHFNKHRSEFNYTTKEQYLEGANKVINNPNALKKVQAEDGDYVFLVPSTNEFVVLSSSGTIRTYFIADDGIAYFNRQQITFMNFVA